MANRALTGCDHCGQQDDHPKHHFGVETYHHDCAPARVVNQVTAESQVDDPDIAEHAKRALTIRKLALDGTRGEKLLARIEKLDKE